MTIAPIVYTVSREHQRNVAMARVAAAQRVRLERLARERREGGE